MGGLLLKLENFKKVKLIFGHPVSCIDTKIVGPTPLDHCLKKLHNTVKHRNLPTVV